jgi:hypothetical protein
MQKKIYFPVNWTDGMKINKSHFIAQDNAFTFNLAQNTSCLLNELNYGILPLKEGGSNLKIVISSDNQKKLQVRILQCRAITAGGYYIEINDETGIPNNMTGPVVSVPASLRELTNKASQFYVVLTIDPYKRNPYGVMESPETPPRIPFSVPTLSVDLIPVADVIRNILGPYQLPVGKINIEDQRIMLEDDYIPPCTSINSHPELLEIQAALEQFYGKMEVYALQIIQKIVQKKQTNEMSIIVQKLCDNICFFTASQLTELKSTGSIQPTVNIVIKVASLARMMKNTLDCFIGSGKDELVTYFTEWCNIKQGELEGAISTLANHQYDHIDINDSIDKVSGFTKLISKLFYQLSRLEYIGKRRESGIFVKEETIKTDGPPAKRRSFLAD